MSADVFLIVLFAAFLHAVWNAVVKGAADRTIVRPYHLWAYASGPFHCAICAAAGSVNMALYCAVDRHPLGILLFPEYELPVG